MPSIFCIIHIFHIMFFCLSLSSPPSLLWHWLKWGPSKLLLKNAHLYSLVFKLIEREKREGEREKRERERERERERDWLIYYIKFSISRKLQLLCSASDGIVLQHNIWGNVILKNVRLVQSMAMSLKSSILLDRQFDINQYLLFDSVRRKIIDTANGWSKMIMSYIMKYP